MSEKKRLTSDAKNFSKLIQSEVGNLLKAKTIGLKLNALLQQYTMKIKQDQLSKIKLVDRVQIKKSLKAKLLKDLEGFRTTGTQFADVNKVDPNDLKKIVKKIKKQLGI